MTADLVGPLLTAIAAISVLVAATTLGALHDARSRSSALYAQLWLTLVANAAVSVLVVFVAKASGL